MVAEVTSAGPAARPWRVSVRELVEFVARTGDLTGVGIFRPGRAWQGMRLHQRLQKSRPPEYQSEVWLARTVQRGGICLEVRGRADGIWPRADGTVLEEIKSFERGAVRVEADPVHWAQAMIYGHLHAAESGLEEMEIQLTYVELENGETIIFRQRKSKTELELFFDQIVAQYAPWAQRQVEWLMTRDAALRALKFPHAFRAGQRSLAAAVYRVADHGGKLFAEAPTGIGKTLSVLFPALKALERGRYEKVLYLTATTVGRGVAEAALEQLRGQSGLKLRCLTLTAREKICFGTAPCNPAECVYARGYFDRVKAALAAALAHENLTRETVLGVAAAHQLCPFALSLDLLSWVDAVICDYNYVFDPSAQLRGFLEERTHLVLVDEAHNLVERGRAIFSAGLSPQELGSRVGAQHPAGCQRALRQLRKFVQDWAGEHGPESDEPGYSRTLPTGVAPLLRRFLNAAEKALWKDGGAAQAAQDEKLVELYFAVNRFARAVDWWDERFACLVETGEEGFGIRLACLDPGFLLRRMTERAWAVVFFSATLSPLDYFRDSLGGEGGDVLLRLGSPFPPEHLQVLVADRIRTSYRARAQSYEDVAGVIRALTESRRGNYLVYFPSYAYLDEVKRRLECDAAAGPILAQRPGFSEEERREFLGRFQQEPEEPVVGLAVMGGLFGEGIDLPGDRLIGTVIVGVGLPQVTLERNLMRAYFQEKNGMGFEFAYLYPGMNRVLQAAGRVIRSETDRGIVLLVDSRFRENRYRALLPSGWECQEVESAEEICRAAERFWNGDRS